MFHSVDAVISSLSNPTSNEPVRLLSYTLFTNFHSSLFYSLFPAAPIVVGYEVVEYTTSEGTGSVELCAVVSSHPAGTPRDFTISATTQDGVGTASMLMSMVKKS